MRHDRSCLSACADNDGLMQRYGFDNHYLSVMSAPKMSYYSCVRKIRNLLCSFHNQLSNMGVDYYAHDESDVLWQCVRTKTMFSADSHICYSQRLRESLIMLIEQMANFRVQQFIFKRYVRHFDRAVERHLSLRQKFVAEMHELISEQSNCFLKLLN